MMIVVEQVVVGHLLVVDRLLVTIALHLTMVVAVQVVAGHRCLVAIALHSMMAVAVQVVAGHRCRYRYCLVAIALHSTMAVAVQVVGRHRHYYRRHYRRLVAIVVEASMVATTRAKVEVDCDRFCSNR
jgi:hypothetical protein